MNNYEFDKTALSIAFSIFAIIFCINVGDLIYYPKIPIKERGYKIDTSSNIVSHSEESEKEVNEQNLDLKTLFAESSYARGEKIFGKCSICHTIEKGAPNKIGPNLWNIVDNKVASNINFSYSAAMSHKRESGSIWSYQELINYLKAPKKYVPGTKMAFAGIKKLQDRIDLIEFLRNYSDKPAKKP